MNKSIQKDGMTLHWSEEYKRYLVPFPEPNSALRILYDPETDIYIQVVTNPDLIYRDRTATAPDGTKFTEKIIIESRPLVQMSDVLEQKKKQVMNSFLDIASGMMPVFFVGFLVTTIWFFIELISNIGLVAEGFASGTVVAMHEFGYLIAWVFGVLLILIIIRYMTPIIFKRRSTDLIEPPPPMSNSTNIVVNNIRGDSNSAQDYINKRS